MHMQLNNSIWLIICATFVNLFKLSLVTFEDLFAFYSSIGYFYSAVCCEYVLNFFHVK